MNWSDKSGVEFPRWEVSIRAMKCWMSLLCLLSLWLGTLHGADSEARRGFFAAIEAGDTARVTKYLDSDISPDATNKLGVNALYLACDKWKPAVAQLLITRGADVNLTPPHGSTALQVAILRGFDAYHLKPKEGYPELIQTLLAKGADVNASDVNGNTALISAAKMDDVATLKLLLERKVDLAHTNENGWTALELAVMNRRRTIAHQLVKAGAPLDASQQKMYDRYHFARMAGKLFPFLLVGSFLLAVVMHRRFKALPKPAEKPEAGDDLPNLLPLKCPSCGGSASLRPGVAKCSHCHGDVPVPEDYTETLKLRARTFKLMEKAVRLWRRVRVISAPPVQIALLAAAIWFVWYMWKGLFPQFVRDAYYNLMTFGGTMVWVLGVLTMCAIAIALIVYAIYLHEVRKALPPLPATGKLVGGEEDTECRNCGGHVDLRAGEIASLCGYCGSEIYRVALAREARGVATEEKEAATFSVHQAMCRVYEMRENAALALPFAILIIGAAVAFVVYVILMFI